MRERDRYAEKRSACGGLFLHAKRLRKLRNVVNILSLRFMALMFISGLVGLEKVTHDAQWREGGRCTTKARNKNVLYDIQLLISPERVHSVACV